MNKTTTALAASLGFAMLASIASAFAQGQKTLASSMDIYVFPTEGQDASQQSKDEAECYGWAVNSSGSDPFELSKQSAQAAELAQESREQAAEAAKGAGARGALGGAAAGAVIGEVASDDAGEGAAYGAAAGLIASRVQARRKQAQAAQQADLQVAETQRYTAEERENFEKAFSVCLEAKGYLVKY